MLVLGLLSTDVVKDLLACIYFVKSLHCIVLLPTSFDCLSFMNMYSGLLHSGDCQLSSLRRVCSCMAQIYERCRASGSCTSICFRRSIASGLTEDDRTEVLLMSSCCLLERNMLSNDSDLRKMSCFMQLSSPILFREVTGM